MKILGVDPGLIRLGFGAVEYSNNNLNLITYGIISNPKKETQSYNEHLTSGIHQITNDFPRILDLVNPDYIYAEFLPPGRLGSNSDSVMAAITVCKVIAYQFGIPWYNIAASTIKKELTGDGKATKAVVRNAILALYPKVKDRHLQIKREEKEAGEKMVGLPQDIFDGLAIATIGSQTHGRIKVS